MKPGTGIRSILPDRSLLPALVIAAVVSVFVMNYAIPLGYAVSSLLLALIAASVIHGYRNVSPLRVAGIEAEGCFAGEPGILEITLHNPARHGVFSINVRYGHEVVAIAYLGGGQSRRIDVLYHPRQRGIQDLGGITITSAYPLGLLMTRKYLSLRKDQLVYPKRLPCHLGQILSSRLGSVQARQTRGGDPQPAGVRAYARGDAPGRIHWRLSARGQGLMVKEFDRPAPHMDSLMLCWSDVPGDTEERLSRLCEGLLHLEAQRRFNYGLSLPGIDIPPGQGREHLARCLQQLALF